MVGVAEFFANLFTSTAKDLVCGAIHEARYCCCFKSFVRDLKNEKDKLLKYKERVNEHAIREERKKVKKIEDEDKDWLQAAETVLEEVEKLEVEVEIHHTCCLGRLPNCICRYLMGRKLVQQKDNVKQHCDKRPTYKGINRLDTLPGMEYFSSENFMKFGSRQSAYEQLKKTIEDDGVSRIGLYGMGGCGKTTLATEAGKEAEKCFNFKVVLVVVSKKVEVKRIQDKIASSLGFELNENEEMERAKRLSMRLHRNDEKLLIILDDVWEKLNFQDIGIPFEENCKSCKVLMTTRSFDVCSLMDCQPIISLLLLSYDESWALFQKHAHFTEETSNALKDLAKEITKKCGGLPVAIAAVASTLKGKTLDEWEVALEALKYSRPVGIEKGLQDPYKCLELSYNNLQSEEAKSLFLLCSVFPEDSQIPCEFLFKLGIGLGLFERVSTYAMTRKRAIRAKNKLLHSCLLLEVEYDKGSECVKMHDLIHDVALWIAKKENKAIMMIEGEKNSSEEDIIMEGTQIKYLYCERFPNKLDCAELELLIFNSDSVNVEVPIEFFKRMEKLRSMVLIGNDEVLRLPNSIQTLIHLRYLLLCGWKLGDISFLENLEGLQTLSLERCVFPELPVALTQLANLNVLTISECKIAKNPCEVIGRCSQLEELDFTKNDGIDWTFDDEMATEFLNKFSNLKRLQNYTIEIGEVMKEFDTMEGCKSRSLVIEHFDVSTSNAAMKELVRKTECLSLGHIKGGCKNIIPDMFQIRGGGMTDLIELVLHNSEEIYCLIDNTGLKCQVGTLFPKLSNLCITRMEHLATLYHGLPYPGIFEKLKKLCIWYCSQLDGVLFVGKLDLCSLEVLELVDCPKLTSLFTPDSVQSLLQLQDLKIESCSELMHIIIEEVQEDIIDDDNDEQIFQLPFQKLKNLFVMNCKRLKYIVPVSYTHGLVQLEIVEIIRADELNFLFGPHNYANQLVDPTNNEFQIKLPMLKFLKLRDLPNIVSIFPENYYPVWPSLHEFRVYRCPQFVIVSLNQCAAGFEVRKYCSPTKGMDPLVISSNHESGKISPLQTLLGLEKLNVTGSNKRSIFEVASFSFNVEFVLPLAMRLKSLSLEDHELSYICKGPVQIMSLQNLVQLTISGCGKIKSIFSTNSFESMPQLEVIRIDNCNQMEQIIAKEESDNTMNGGTKSSPKGTSNCCKLHPGSLNLISLKQLKIFNCPMLRSLFTLFTVRTLTSLEVLNVSQCDGLKEIISYESSCESKMEESLLQSHFSVLFSKLKNLDVADCNLLECIFPVSLTPSLMELKCISICNAHKLRYLFGEGNLEHYSFQQYQNMIRFELPVLEHLTIEGLPNLISICPSNYYTVCPSLQKIRLDHLGLSNPTTDNLDYTSTMDLGTTIMKDLPFIREMTLLYQYEIQYLCISPKRLLNLQNLSKLRVEGCGKLKAMFSVSILANLPQLNELIVKECEELEQITIEDKENENMSHPYSKKICFPQLKILLIKHCNKLKHLFSISTSRKFPKLECLFIKEASQLEEVFEGRKGETEMGKEILFPKLKYLILAQLQSLMNVWQGIELQTVTCRVVQNCPNLSLTTTLQKSIKKLRSEILDIKDIRWYVKNELLDILMEENLNEAASGSQPTSPQIVEVAKTEGAQNGLVIKEAEIATCSTDLAPTNSPLIVSSINDDLQMAASQESIKKDAKNETIMIDLQELRETGSNKHFKELNKEAAQEGLPKANATISLIDLELREFTSLYKSCPHSFEAMLKESALRDPTIEEATIVTSSDDLAPRNLPPNGSLVIHSQEKVSPLELTKNMPGSDTIMTHQPLAEKRFSMQHNASQNDVTEEAQDGLPTGKAKIVMTNKDDSISKEIMKEQPIWQSESSNDYDTPNLPSGHAQAVLEPETDVASSEELKKTVLMKMMSRTESFMRHKQAREEARSDVFTKTFQEGLPIGKFKTVAPSPQVMVNKDKMCKPIVEEQAIWKSESTSDTPNLPSDQAQSVLESKTYGVSKVELKKTSMESSLVPKLKGSSGYPSYASLDKTFSQISPNHALSPFSSTLRNPLAELPSRTGIDKFTLSPEFSSCRLILEPNLLQDLKTKLAEYLNMPLEDVLKANAFDDVENTVNSLAEGTTDVIQKNILGDFSNRLKHFKECIPKAISNVQSSSEFISNYESLNVELNTKMSKGKEILRDLECKLSETCEEEYEIEMEIQQLITRKMEILAQKNSLSSQHTQFTEAISEDFAKWKALGEELKLSTEKWLKSKEDLAHANASWKLFKESLGF